MVLKKRQDVIQPRIVNTQIHRYTDPGVYKILFIVIAGPYKTNISQEIPEREISILNSTYNNSHF